MGSWGALSQAKLDHAAIMCPDLWATFRHVYIGKSYLYASNWMGTFTGNPEFPPGIFDGKNHGFIWMFP